MRAEGPRPEPDIEWPGLAADIDGRRDIANAILADAAPITAKRRKGTSRRLSDQVITVRCGNFFGLVGDASNRQMPIALGHANGTQLRRPERRFFITRRANQSFPKATRRYLETVCSAGQGNDKHQHARRNPSRRHASLPRAEPPARPDHRITRSPSSGQPPTPKLPCPTANQRRPSRHELRGPPPAALDHRRNRHSGSAAGCVRSRRDRRLSGEV